MKIEGDGVNLRLTCESVPVQFEGTVDGYPAYFRARYSGWSFTIARTEEAAVGASVGIRDSGPGAVLFDTGGYADDDGCGYCAGMMPLADATRLIWDCIERLRMTVRQRIPAATTDQGAGSEASACLDLGTEGT